MQLGRKALIGGLLAASALIAPQAAWAKPATSVEARLDRLEAEVSGLNPQLQRHGVTSDGNVQLPQRGDSIGLESTEGISDRKAEFLV